MKKDLHLQPLFLDVANFALPLPLHFSFALCGVHNDTTDSGIMSFSVLNLLDHNVFTTQDSSILVLRVPQEDLMKIGLEDAKHILEHLAL